MIIPSAQYCDKLLVQKEVFPLVAYEIELHMGADLVTKDGRETIKRSRDGWQESQHQTYT